MVNYLFALLQIPAPAPTGDEMSWVLSSLSWIVEQFKMQNYVPAVGMVVMLLVFAFNKLFKDTIKPQHLPLLSAGLGVLSAVCVNLMALAVGSKPTDWVSAIFAGLTVGAAASGFWSLLGKAVMTKLAAVFGKKPEPELELEQPPVEE